MHKCTNALGPRPADRAVLFDAVASGERQSNARAFCAEGAENFFSKNSENFRDQLAYVKRLSFILLRSLFRLRAKFLKNGREEIPAWSSAGG